MANCLSIHGIIAIESTVSSLAAPEILNKFGHAQKGSPIFTAFEKPLCIHLSCSSNSSKENSLSFPPCGTKDLAHKSPGRLEYICCS